MATKKVTKAKEKSPQELIQELTQKEHKMWESAGVGRRFIISFPGKQKPPLLGRFGAFLLKTTGGRQDVQYYKLKK